MKTFEALVSVALAAFALGSESVADGLVPGSVLVFPIHRSGSTGPVLPPGAVAPGGPFLTVVTVTNTNLVPVTPLNGLGGSTNAHWEYVNVLSDPQNPFGVLDCSVLDRVELLTPGDTRSVLTNCHDGSARQGYLVVTAQDPNAFDLDWSHNYLVGSELVLRGTIGYAIEAIPFEALDPKGTPTDHDGDGELDFDGIEYEPAPDHLYLDALVDAFFPSIALINLSGGTAFTATVALDIFNDNEQALSATLTFRCWTERFLQQISVVFTPGFLAANTLDDPDELDTNCDGVGDFEAAWARLRGLTNSSPAESYANPAILGAHTRNVSTAGGRRMWESVEKQTNGDFLKTGTDDPEFP